MTRVDGFQIVELYAAGHRRISNGASSGRWHERPCGHAGKRLFVKVYPELSATRPSLVALRNGPVAALDVEHAARFSLIELDLLDPPQSDEDDDDVEDANG